MGLIIVCGMVAPAMAADARQGAENSMPLPSYQSKTRFFAGYRWVNLDDSERAGEYQDLHSSLTVGIDALSCPLPHRFHLNGEFLNKNDVYADTGYAYSDLLLFRDIFVRVHHNLDHSDYQYSGEPPKINYEDRNVGDRYSTDVSNNFLSLRLKAPNFPFHIFLKHRYVDKEGSIQQRFLLGGFDNIHKISETRRIDWRSNAITLEVNSHLGPMEIEYTHDFSRFDPGGDNVLYDFYPATGARSADIYPHNVIPETESRANSLKLHTSYTGRIVASVTLDNGHRKNNYSGAVADTWQGAVDVSWVSDPSLMFFFKYRHRDLALDNPDSVTLSGLAHTMTYPVRRSISSRKDIFPLSASLRPISRLTIIPAYHFEHLARQDSAAWRVLPKYTDIHSIKLTAYARSLNQLKVKAIYDYKYDDHPAYNIEPDSSNQIRFSTTYLPAPWLTALLDYSLTLSTRDYIRYLNGEPDTVVDGGKRTSRNDPRQPVLYTRSPSKPYGKLGLLPGRGQTRSGLWKMGHPGMGRRPAVHLPRSSLHARIELVRPEFKCPAPGRHNLHRRYQLYDFRRRTSARYGHNRNAGLTDLFFGLEGIRNRAVDRDNQKAPGRLEGRTQITLGHIP